MAQKPSDSTCSLTLTTAKSRTYTPDKQPMDLEAPVVAFEAEFEQQKPTDLKAPHVKFVSEPRTWGDVEKVWLGLQNWTVEQEREVLQLLIEYIEDDDDRFREGFVLWGFSYVLEFAEKLLRTLSIKQLREKVADSSDGLECYEHWLKIPGVIVESWGRCHTIILYDAHKKEETMIEHYFHVDHGLPLCDIGFSSYSWGCPRWSKWDPLNVETTSSDESKD